MPLSRWGGNPLRIKPIIQTVVCRHEQNAAFIAGGIGRLTGKAGVAIATSGPGVSNLTTGLLTANSEGDPLVALGGAVPTSQGIKQVHQTFQGVAAFRPLTKFSAEASSPESVGEVLANAFAAAESDRPGAAFVSLPKDIMEGPADCEALTGTSTPAFGPGSRESIEEAARIVNSSQRPVMLLGRLASSRRLESTDTTDWDEAQRQLRERLGARDDNTLETVRKGKQLTFNEWADFFLENYSKPPIRAAKTHEANENALKTLRPMFGTSKLLDIDATQIEVHLRARLQQKRRVRRKSGMFELGTLKASSVHQEFRVLRRIFSVAVRKKLVPTIRAPRSSFL